MVGFASGSKVSPGPGGTGESDLGPDEAALSRGRGSARHSEPRRVDVFVVGGTRPRHPRSGTGCPRDPSKPAWPSEPTGVLAAAGGSLPREHRVPCTVASHRAPARLGVEVSSTASGWNRYGPRGWASRSIVAFTPAPLLRSTMRRRVPCSRTSAFLRRPRRRRTQTVAGSRPRRCARERLFPCVLPIPPSIGSPPVSLELDKLEGERFAGFEEGLQATERRVPAGGDSGRRQSG